MNEEVIVNKVKQALVLIHICDSQNLISIETKISLAVAQNPQFLHKKLNDHISERKTKIQNWKQSSV